MTAAMTQVPVPAAIFGRRLEFAWYRDKGGKVKEIFLESKLTPSYKYRANWIAFYR